MNGADTLLLLITAFLFGAALLMGRREHILMREWQRGDKES